MDGGNSSSAMSLPCVQQPHNSQRLESSAATSEQCSSVHYMSDSQLVAVPYTVAGGSPTTVAGLDKRKRGRPPRQQAAKPPPPAKKPREEDEDVCFICFDGGSLVLCDRKGCPKAYHPACIKRDESFFRSKAKWNCGWHICSVCQRASHYLCYTCTYSLCKACTKNTDYLCVRGNKGFCSTCMRTIMLIENKDQANKEMVDFDDKSSWEYLFKVYWVILKEKLSLTLDELVQAKNPWKESVAVHGKRPLLPYGHYVANDGKGVAGKSFDHLEQKRPIELLELSKKDPPTTESRTIAESNNASILSSTSQSELTKPAEELAFLNEDCLRTKQGSTAVQTSVNGCTEWASKELLDFVAHMKDGDTSAISQFDVQALLLDYIKKNNLRDPRQKSQIICDLRLKSLFGKPRVGHIEMLKLLEFHYLIKEDPEKSAFIPAGIVGTATGHVVPDDSNAISSSKKRKSRKNGEVKMAQINLDEYAAINAHNINFLYLRRDLMENLAEDVEKFHDRVIGSVVRIRIPGNDQKQEIYRLVHVVGTCKSSEPYKLRDKTVDVLLEVLNLDKKEALSIDSISNQDFCEDECRRLRQSIKCGLVKRPTVGEIQKKAMELRAVKLNDSLEAEILRLSHLRDRASEKGHKKELRECIERLELLKTPKERQRRLLEIPEVHADPKMDPDYASEGDDGEYNDKRKVKYPAPRCTRISRRDEKLLSSGSLVKEEGSIMAQCRMSEKREACGTNIMDKQGKQLTVEQAVDRSGSETSITSLSTVNSSSVNGSETEKLWHYRDPAKRIQGPFSVMQLRKWNTSGLFPPDMRIWTNHEHEDSILLTNALKGLFHKESQVHDKTSSQSRVPAASDSRTCVSWSESAGAGVECRKREIPGHLHNANHCSNGNTEFTRMNGLSPSFPQCVDSLKGNNSCSDKPQLSSTPSSSQREVILALPRQRGHENDNCRSVADQGTQNSRKSTLCYAQSNSRNLGPPSDQNAGSFTSNKCSINVDFGSTFASATKSSDSFEQKGKMNLPDLPSPTPETSYGDLEAQAAEKLLLLSSVIPGCGSDIHDLPSPTPISNSEAQGGHEAENKESGPSSLPDSEAQGGHAAENKESGRSSLPVSEAQGGHAAENKESGRSSLPDSEAQGGHAAENKESGPSSLPDSEAQVGHAAGNKESGPSSFPDSEAQGGHATENKESGPSSLPVQESGQRCSSASSPVVGGAQLRVIADEWGRNSPGAKPSTEEWDSGLVSDSSLKPTDTVGDHVATPTSNADQLTAKPQEWDSGLVSVSSLKPAEAVGDHVATLTSNADQLTAKPSTEEWDSGLVSVSSLKPAEAVGDHVATPTSNAGELNHTSPSHPVSNFFGEPIEFSTLAEESVSDLLAEVDAMESQNHNGMGSPTSAMRCGEEMIPGCKTDCFSPIEELSPTHDPVRSDALSSTGDLQLPCQSTLTDETVGASRADAFDPLRRSGGNSSTSSEGETKSADVLISQGDVGSNIPAPCTTSQATAFSAMGRSIGFEGMTSGRGAAPGNPSWGGPVHGYANVGFGSTPGAAWGNSNMNRGAPFTGNPVWDNQRRYAGERSGGPRDWALQGGESGFGRGRPSWNRQQPYGGGGYSRPPPKGQRICKFYESGRCKKGAACDYRHP
ncbi:zinc finger CCCH domain-containing protein 44-like [Lycium barbarum]|uniref:zinc finger CCCH domain-containing protein 44-like n=1 Tax=Lycium barbarum TaxID=112863 RepID=UPI00293E4B85|nr:zinc finger CCCH domain-containing protein 44-like [Lycium barbarum]